MNIFLNRIAGIILILGACVGCATLSHSNSDTTSPDHYSEKQLHQRIDSVNKTLARQPKNTDLLYQKGQYLTELAQKQQVISKRLPYYIEAQKTLNNATILNAAEDNSKKNEKLHELLKVTWSNEHNQGIQIMQDDSTLEDRDFKKAAAHFKNATTIIPDSSISYEMEALAYYRNRQNKQAIDILEEAQNKIAPPSSSLLEKLAFLYLETDQPNKAVQVYERAESFSDQNLNLLHGLSNAYLTAGEYKKAVDLLELLVKNEPDNIIYKKSLATELYHLAVQKIPRILTDLDSGKKLKNTDYPTADSLFSEAETQFKYVKKHNPSDTDFTEQFAAFYQNSAANLQKVVSHASKTEAKPVEKKIQKYISASVPLLKGIVDQDQSNKKIWKNLYQAYTYLGMNKKADSVKRKANL